LASYFTETRACKKILPSRKWSATIFPAFSKAIFALAGAHDPADFAMRVHALTDELRSRLQIDREILVGKKRKRLPIKARSRQLSRS